jgi:hypothetical protein
MRLAMTKPLKTNDGRLKANRDFRRFMRRAVQLPELELAHLQQEVRIARAEPEHLEDADTSDLLWLLTYCLGVRGLGKYQVEARIVAILRMRMATQ